MIQLMNLAERAAGGFVLAVLIPTLAIALVPLAILFIPLGVCGRVLGIW